MSMKTITNDIFSSLVSSSKTTGYDTTATVTRIDNDGVCWVHIDGGVAETPTSMAVNAIPGDIVRVRVSGGDAWITGNDSKPPTDDAEAFVANRKAVIAQSYAEIAQVNAERANAKLAIIEQAIIDELDTRLANIDVANIDFANIDLAQVATIFSEAGIVDDLTTETGTITGELVGVTISGDLIQGNTIKANKLVVLGSDGLYYKLNVSGETVEAQQTDYNSINGSHIQAQSITASKISVTDLVAFGATIAGLILENGSIHSTGKTLNNSVNGIYMDSQGQFNTGNSANYIKSWKDPLDDKWKIDLRANEILFSSGANVEDELATAKSDAETAKTSIDQEINGYLSVVVESSVYEESAIEIDAEKYGNTFGEGTNTFVYTNNHWYLNGSLATEEDFSNYGMTIKQTPVEGDSFNVISTNVESLSSSLTNLREEVNSNSDSISNLIDHAESNTSSISALSEESSATTETVDDLTAQVQELSDALYGEKTEREARMTFGTDSAGDPILTLGGGAHSDFQMDLTNLELAFKEKNYTVASISGHVLTIENANVSSQLQMGNFAWIPRKNGHLTLKYIG